MWKPIALGLAFAIALSASLLDAQVSHANNVELVPVGDQAALLGRAVVASSSDAGSLWYNPAGLSWLSTTSVNLSGSAFVLRLGDLRDLYALQSAGGELLVDEEFSGLLSVPSALVFVRQLSDGLTGAVGVFIPYALDIFMRRTDSFTGAEGKTEWGFQALSQVQDTRAGAGLGLQVSDDLRIGLAAFGTYRREKTILQAWSFTQAEGRGPASDALQFEELGSEYGTQAVMGAQYDVHPAVRLGVALRSPVWRVVPDTDLIQFSVVARDDGAEVLLNDSDAGVPKPWSIRESAAVRFGTEIHGRGLSANLEGEYRAASEELDDALNARAGLGYELSPGTSFGFGLFFDRSQAKSVGAGDFTADYYGGSLGARLGELAGGGGVKFHTTVAASYAIGFGRLNRVHYDPDSATPITIGPDDITFTSHDLSLYVGSGIEF